MGTSEETLPEKMPRLDASNEITTEGGKPEMTTMASDGEIATEDKATTTQSSSESRTEPAPMEGDEAITKLDGGLVTVTPGTVSDETSFSSDDVDENSPKDEVTTVSPTSVTVLSIEETDDGVTIVTTMLPTEDTITTAKPVENIEDTNDDDQVGTTLKTESDTTTQATNIDGDNAEDQTTQKSEVTSAKTDSESETTTITIGSEAVSETTSPKTDIDTTTPKSEVDTTELTEDADDMADKDDVTTPKTFVDKEDVDGEGRSMLEESSTTLPGNEDITTPKSESESTVPSVSQEGSTEAPVD